MSGVPQNGDFSRSEQGWEYDDGSTRMQSQHSQQSWSSSSHMTMSTAVIQPPSMPILQASPFHDMHQQMHASAMAHHHSVMQNMNAMHQSMQANMNSIFSPGPQDRLVYSSHMQSPPTSYQSLPYNIIQQQLTAPQPRLTGPTVTEINSEEETYSEEDSSSEEDEIDALQQTHAAQRLQMEARYVADQANHEAQRRNMEQRLAAKEREQVAEKRALEKQHKDVQQEMLKQGNIMNDRLRRLEERESKSRAEQEAKEQDMRSLREENNKLTQQRLVEAEKHRAEMADLARMHASRPQESPTIFDTSALETIIREVQAKQLSKADIEKVIQERVESQLSGLAKKKDIEAAGSEMQRALKAVPSGASAAQVQDAINRELGKAIDKLSSNVKARQGITDNPQGPALPATSPTTSQLTLPDDSAKPLAEKPVMPSAGAVVKTSKRKMKESRSCGPDKHESTSTVQATLQSAIAPEKTAEMSSSALINVKKDKKMSESLRESIDKVPSAPLRLVDDFPENASQITSWERSKSRKASVRALPTIKETSLLEQALVKKSKPSKSSSLSTDDIDISQLASKINSTTLYDDLPENASQISTWQRGKASQSAKPTLSTIDEAASEGALVKASKDEKSRSTDSSLVNNSRDDKHSAVRDTSLVKSSKHGRTLSTGETSLTKQTKNKNRNHSVSIVPAALTLADIPGHIGNTTLPSMTPALQLPDDFPENASQISTWERKQAKVLKGSSPLAQIGHARGDQDLVRLDKSKKHASK